MAARVTAAEVREILPESQLTDVQVSAFISGATVLVDSAIGSSSELSDDLKKEIERWLTAHMIATTVERMAVREGAGGASITYTGQFGSELSASPYGQMVITLDSTGRMASLGGKAASIYAVTSF